MIKDDETLQGKGRKRAAPRGKGRGTTSTAKRGKKSDNAPSIQRMLMNLDDEDDDDEVQKKSNKSQPRVSGTSGNFCRIEFCS